MVRFPTGVPAQGRGKALLPSFFVVGPPRTGTSWLHDVLAEHTSLPSVKETRFFDLYFKRGLDWYSRYFDSSAADKPCGEVAPTYFVSGEARAQIARARPEARIVCIFRHPVERAFSLYRLKRAYGMIRCRFEEAMRRDPELLDSGRYATHLKKWRQAMGEDRVLATRYETLRDDPQAYVNSVADFIRIPRFALTDAQMRHVHGSSTFTKPRYFPFTRVGVSLALRLKRWHLERFVTPVMNSPLKDLFFSAGEPLETISIKTQQWAVELFLDEIDRLEILTGWHLEGWKTLAGSEFFPRAPNNRDSGKSDCRFATKEESLSEAG